MLQDLISELVKARGNNLTDPALLRVYLHQLEESAEQELVPQEAACYGQSESVCPEPPSRTR